MCEPWAWACAAAADDMRAGHPRRHCHQASAAPLQPPRPLPHPLAAAPTLVSCLAIVYRWCQAGLRQTTSHQSVRSVASVTPASFSVHCTLYTVQAHLLGPAVPCTHGDCTVHMLAAGKLCKSVTYKI